VVAVPFASLPLLFGLADCGELVVGVVGSVGVPVEDGGVVVSPAFGRAVGLLGLVLSTGGGVVVVWLPVDVPGEVDVPG
jgi:hypothetical protein